MRRHPAASLVSLLAISCIAAPIAEDQAETDQISAGNYAWSANKDAWTEYLTAPEVDDIVMDGWEIDPGGPGCAVGLVQGGETIYLKGYGMASPWQPWSYQTIAPVGSVAKTITALSLRELGTEAGFSMNDTFGAHLPGSGFDDFTLVQLLSHGTRVQGNPDWDPGSMPDSCGGPCDFDTSWQISRPRVAWVQMDDSLTIPADPGFIYSNVDYSALGALIDDKTHDAAWLDPDERGYEAYTWHRVGRFKGNDTYKGQMLTLALTHSWRVDEHDIPNYAHGYEYGTGDPAEAWDEPAGVDGREGWEGPSGGWVMSIGDLARLIESFDNYDIVTYGTTAQMTTVQTDVLGGYGQGIAVKNPPEEGAPGGTAPEVPDGGTPEAPDHEWWHGGDIGGHVAVWAYWPDLPGEEAQDTFGVALICNKRDGDHAAMGELLPVAEAIKEYYLANDGITIWNSQEITGLATLEEVDDQDYLLDLTHARVVDPPSFYLPLDLHSQRVWVSTDAVGTRLSLKLVQGPDPDAPNAPTTALGTVTYAPGMVLSAGVGASANISVPGAGSVTLKDVRIKTGFARYGTDLASATLSGTVDLRQIGQLHDDGWTGICTDLSAEASCKACTDGVRACLDLTIGYLEGADQ